MHVCLLSAFRNAERTILDYAGRVLQLRERLTARGDTLCCIWGEGDSADDSGALLQEIADATPLDACVVDVTHGGPPFGSVVHPQRFKQLAYVANTLLTYVPDNADAVLIVESDLLWEAETLIRLLDGLGEVDAVAPMVMDGPCSFYDIWAYRISGQQFSKAAPYHPALATRDGARVQLDSAGSCVAVRGELARRCRFPEEDVFVGFCRQVKWFGGSIWLDPACVVYHP